GCATIPCRASLSSSTRSASRWAAPAARTAIRPTGGGPRLCWPRTPSAPPREFLQGYTWGPIHDEACWVYTYAWHPDRPLSEEERARFEKGGYGQFAGSGPGDVPLPHRYNAHLIDREEQKHRSFTGVRGVAEQDALAQDSQGLIADRTREHLTPIDVAVVR